MEAILGEVIKEIGEMRRRIKELEGKLYRSKEERIKMEKRIENLEEENWRRAGEIEEEKESKRKVKDDMADELKRMAMKKREEECMEESECEEDLEMVKIRERNEKERRDIKIEKWREEREEIEREEIRKLEKKALIVKRGEKANKKMDLEKWIERNLRVEKVKIVKA